MIHSLKHNPQSNTFTFIFVTSIGRCRCIVRLNDLNDDHQPKMFVDQYEILGQKVKNSHWATPTQGEGINRLTGALEDTCIGNNWALWSY